VRVKLRTSTALLAALGLVAVAGCGSGQQGAPPPEPRAGGPSAERVDAHFVAHMIPHHESAVDMGRLALERAEHRELRDLADGIVHTQTAEIRELRELERDLAPATGPMPPGMEMMGHEDIGALRRADPFDRAFIDEMVPHHQMAVNMAQIAIRDGRDPRVRALGEQIETSQRREIDQMNGWRDEWYGAPVPGGGTGSGGGRGDGPTGPGHGPMH